MNINTVIDYLNKTYGYDLDGSYYNSIDTWSDWWKGYYKPFHCFSERGLDGNLTERKIYSLKMAKKVSEDWAAMLLNEKTIITVDDKASSTFLEGEGKDANGVLGSNSFWTKANKLIEKTFAMGTGAFVLRLENMKIVKDVVVKDSDTTINIEYLSAGCIIPLTVRHDSVIDVAFVSEVLESGEKYIYIETHILKDNGYEITNAYFKDEEGTLKKQPLPEGILPMFSTGSDIPLFCIIEPNLCNNVDEGTAMGMSIYANALDNLEGTDLAYNNFNRDFRLGGKKVFVNEDLIKHDEHGNAITPDDVAQQLFTSVGDTLLKNGENTMIQEHNPALRVSENVEGIQAQLDYLSFKCGLGAKFYRFNSGNVVTATQYTGDRQDLIQNVNKNYLVIDDALKKLIKSILWVGKEVCGANTNPDAKIDIKFDDSFITDKESERARDLQDVRDGLMQKWEYRVKWYGETEVEAKKKLEESVPSPIFGGDE